METRIMVATCEDGWEIGHTESRPNENYEWRKVPHSDWVKSTRSLWFMKSPFEIMRDEISIETTNERANNFAAASDNNTDVWYYLGVACRDTTSDEALKWIMGAMAAELKVRSLKFIDLPQLMKASTLNEFVTALEDGRIARNFSKQIFAELMTGGNLDTLISDPRFKEVDTGDIEAMVDGLIKDNPDNFEKARENPKLVQWFVGQAMKATQGKAPAAKVIEIVNSRLKG